MRIHIQEKVIQVKSITTLRVPPRQTINYTAKLEKCPKDFENGTIMLKLNNEREDKLPQMLWAVCKNGKFKLSIKNHTDKELIFLKDEIIGSADMRSVGYYFIVEQLSNNYLKTDLSSLVKLMKKKNFVKQKRKIQQRC